LFVSEGEVLRKHRRRHRQPSSKSSSALRRWHRTIPTKS
jgi:hypothetical protein